MLKTYIGMSSNPTNKLLNNIQDLLIELLDTIKKNSNTCPCEAKSGNDLLDIKPLAKDATLDEKNAYFQGLSKRELNSYAKGEISSYVKMSKDAIIDALMSLENEMEST